MARVAQALGIQSGTPTAEQWQTMRDYQIADYNQLLKFSESNQAKIIFMSLSDQLPVYHDTKRAPVWLLHDGVASSVQDLYDEQDLIFFKDSIDTWTKLGLTNIWDKRERLALCKPMGDVKPVAVDFSFDHYWLDSQNWWYNGKKEIQNIMAWLDLLIDSSRYNQWVPIYEEWQQLQLNILQFQYNYKHIVDCVVNDWSYNIDLTFEQEVVIQHCLIHDHGLNLKTWQLEKFPKNTRDLHKLLEPNIHPL
jgi:hypothetical protein